jgi:glycosyltransferase involved in cell wall biosynthesis
MALIAILWNGLPLYAAAAIAHAVDRGSHEIVVIATRPDVPAVGMEDVCGTTVRWIGRSDHPSFRDLGHTIPEVVFIAGWSIPSFMRLAHEARRAGAKIVCMVDNSFRGDLRQCMGALAYRLLYRSFFHHTWVPGLSATKLMQFYGVPAVRISSGLYTCDTSLFRNETPLAQRPIAFTFVGQFTDRKNVLFTCEAFLGFLAQASEDHVLNLYGTGPLRNRLPEHPSIHVHDFAPPACLAATLNESRCLVLCSKLDHWGVAVHEATSCGTLVIASAAVGAAEDLCGTRNARIIHRRGRGIDELIAAFDWAASLQASQLADASIESVRLARRFSPEQWADSFDRICANVMQSSARPLSRRELAAMRKNA